jgi:4-amino-4-deoxy-L-arabinose transferase-like glycosyltransferase
MSRIDTCPRLNYGFAAHPLMALTPVKPTSDRSGQGDRAAGPGSVFHRNRPWLHSPWTMVLAALALRLLVMGFTYPIQMNPLLDHWKFGWETGRVARSIATGHGFSSPYSDPSGPTALIPPVYTYLVAAVFKLCGVYSLASALVLLTLNSLFAALTCLPVYFIAQRIFGLRVAVISGWLWVFFPYSIAIAETTVWETILTTLLVALLLLYTLKLEDSAGIKAWLGYGLLWGLTALTSPATISALPFLVGWIWLRHRRRGRDSTAAASLAFLVCLAVIAPWVWRCTSLYGRLVLLRSNFGLEILVGNSEDISAPANWSFLPWSDPAEMKELQRLGEPEYMARKQQAAVRLIAGNPLRFAGLTARRILDTWTSVWNVPPRWRLEAAGVPNVLTYSLFSLLAFAGLCRALRDGLHGAIPLLILMLFLPAVYYLTHPDLGYRHPVDPAMAILTVYGVLSRRGQVARDELSQ